MSKRDEAILLAVLILGAVAALLLPISAAGFGDVARLFGGR